MPLELELSELLRRRRVDDARGAREQELQQRREQVHARVGEPLQVPAREEHVVRGSGESFDDQPGDIVCDSESEARNLHGFPGDETRCEGDLRAVSMQM